MNTQSVYTPGSGAAYTLIGDSVATDEGTSLAVGYTDLATPGPSVTVTVGASGVLIVFINCQSYVNVAARLALTLSGANTVAASTTTGVTTGTPNNGFAFMPYHVIAFSGLAPGATTVKLQYGTSASTQQFLTRSIIALAP